MKNDLWQTLGRTHEWIRFADTKAGALLAADGALAAAVLGVLDGSDDWWVLALGRLSLTAAGVSAAFSLITLIPRLNVGEPTSIIYFDHIARKYGSSLENYQQAAESILSDEKGLRDELLSQVWANSIVARTKFVMTTRSLRSLAVALALALLMGFAWSW